MKHLFLFFLVIFAPSSHAQKVRLPNPNVPPPPLTRAQIRLERSNHACVHRNKMSAANRQKKFPFNLDSHIEYMSFNYSFNNRGYNIRLPLSDDSVCYSKLKEVVKLSRPQIDSLTDVIYNVGFKGQTLYEEDIRCYEPRNAVLFKDSTSKLIAWLEICFGCQHTRESSEKITLGDICNDKYEMIKTLFRNAGILYGTGKEEEEF